MKTVFRFFPKEAFENQIGLPMTPEDRAWLAVPAEFFLDLITRPKKYCGRTLRLPGPMLMILDRVTGYWPDGVAKGLGSLRAEKTVDIDEWFFKAHFFQDPVQPGSLGVEALCQLLQFFMIEKCMGDGLINPRFESLMTGQPITWKYRGQAVLKNKITATKLHITEIGEGLEGRFSLAEDRLWVDGKCTYHPTNLGMRSVPGVAFGTTFHGQL